MGNIYYSKVRGRGEGETELSLKLTITLTCDKISEIFALCGGMAEWLKAAVLKTVSRKRDVGSNPTPSATVSYSD